MRPTGSSLVAAVGLAALAAVIQRRGGWRPWVAGALAAAGALGYVGYVAARTGVLGGWFVIQREGWGWHLDGGAATARWVAEVLTSSGNVFDLLTVLSLAGSIALFVVAVAIRMPWPLLVYGGLVLVTTWALSVGPASGSFHAAIVSADSNAGCVRRYSSSPVGCRPIRRSTSWLTGSASPYRNTPKSSRKWSASHHAVPRFRCDRHRGRISDAPPPVPAGIDNGDEVNSRPFS